MAGQAEIHSIDDHPLSWLAPLLNGVERANPIVLSLSNDETRATEYSKAATKGNWNGVWASPNVLSLSEAKLSRRLNDQRAKARKGEAANEPGEGDGPGLFGDAGVGVQAAE